MPPKQSFLNNTIPTVLSNLYLLNSPFHIVLLQHSFPSSTSPTALFKLLPNSFFHAKPLQLSFPSSTTPTALSMPSLLNSPFLAVPPQQPFPCSLKDFLQNFMEYSVKSVFVSGFYVGVLGAYTLISITFCLFESGNRIKRILLEWPVCGFVSLAAMSSFHHEESSAIKEFRFARSEWNIHG